MSPKASKQEGVPEEITEIAVQGFKSLYDEQRIAVRPLTILAGANSSGKSSIMQPLLMMKQTLDATYDPGPLKLGGPNVYFTSAEQFLSGLGEEGCIWQVHRKACSRRAAGRCLPLSAGRPDTGVETY